MFKIPTFVKINTLCAAFCSASYVGFHTIFVPSWRLMYISKGEPIPESISNLVTTVMNDMKLRDAEKKKVKPFVMKSLDLRHAGDLGLITGVALGIPLHFMFSEKDDIKLNLMEDKKEGKELPLKSEELAAIKSALLLSDDAKKFAIAQEIYNARHSSFYWICFLPLLLVSHFNVLYIIALIKQVPKFLKHHNMYKIQMVIFAVWSYAFFYSVAGLYKDIWADNQAAKLGNKYLLGGIEFYERIIERNKSLKKWNSKAPYTEDGDYDFFVISKPKISLPLRVTYLKNLKNVISTNQEEPSLWSYVFT